MDYGDAEVLRCRGAEMQIWRIEMMNCRDAEIQRCRRVQRYTKHRCRGADMENREAEVRRYRRYDGEWRWCLGAEVQKCRGTDIENQDANANLIRRCCSAELL